MATTDNTLCACGCGESLPANWKAPVRDPNRKPPRFISGHNCRVMKTKRPDPEPPNPSGMCLCGCGNQTYRAKTTARGNVAGEFVRYLQGHAPEIGRLAPNDPRGPNPSGKCLCGCGQSVGVADRTDEITGTISGCYVRYLLGHDKWKNRPTGVEERTGLCECGCGNEAPIADRSSCGDIKGFPMQFYPGHAHRTQYVVNEATGCWLMHPGDDGYSRLKRDGSHQLAHVWHWEKEHGKVPEGLELDHLCRVRNCVNPEHLEPVTHAENCRRAAAARKAVAP